MSGLRKRMIKIIKKIIRHIRHKYFITYRWHILKKLIDRFNIKTYVEVGVCQGENMLHLRNFFPNLYLIGIDPYKSSEYYNYHKGEGNVTLTQKQNDEMFQQVKNRFSNKNIIIIRKTSVEAAKEFNKVDMVFIDALHDYKNVKDDILAWLPLINVGGILCGHNYSVKYYGLMKAVNEVLGMDNIVVTQDSVWWYRI